MNNCSYFTSPHLIELSSRSNTSVDHLCFWLDYIVHPRIEMHKLFKIIRFISIFTIEDSNMILKTMVDIVLQNYAKNKHERDCLILSIDLNISNKVRIMIKSIIGKWLRKDCNNSDKIIINLKYKRKKRLEKINTYCFKEYLR